MATATYYQRGDAIDYVNSGETTIAAGTILMFGSRLAVAACAISPGAKGAIWVNGTFEMPKDYAASDKAINAGQEVYWDNENSCIKAAVAQVVGTGGDAGKVTTEASPVNGFAVAAAASADETVIVKINA